MPILQDKCCRLSRRCQSYRISAVDSVDDMLKYLLEKEFKQILRNKFLSKLIFVLPVTTIVIFPFVTNQDVQDVKLAVVDQDRSPLSERLVQKASDSGYFRLADVSPTMRTSCFRFRRISSATSIGTGRRRC